MTFWEHLEELRYRLWVSIIAVAVGGGISLLFYQPVLEVLTRPAGGIRLIFTHPSEAAIQILNIALFSGFILSLPFLLYQVWAFVSPALTPREKGWFYWFLFPSLLLFLAGLLFGYFILLPVLLKFLLSVGAGYFEPMLRISSYISFVVWILLICGVMFEMPMLTLLFTITGLMTPAFLIQKWRYFVLGIFIFAAIITPPDVFSQIMVAIPMLVLFGISCIISIVGSKWKGRERESEPSRGISLSK
ncbi:MAG: twin-arginine translocase subunit TatC [bacterium JZ-2024 1]